jgi:hypothetical protein
LSFTSTSLCPEGLDQLPFSLECESSFTDIAGAGHEHIDLAAAIRRCQLQGSFEIATGMCVAIVSVNTKNCEPLLATFALERMLSSH